MSATSTSRRLTGPETGRLFSLPPHVLDLCYRVATVGQRAYLCGGTARDLLAGTVPRDLDLASSATPEELVGILPSNWLAGDQPGRAHGSLSLEIDGRELELTSFRREGSYVDGRRPSEVRFTRDMAADHVRRDFTVNAIYIDPLTGTVHDFCNGLDDLWARRLCCVGDPDRRLCEDSLRVLRALRLSCEHGLVPDRATWGALCRQSDGVASLSGARVLDELGRLFVSPGRGRGLMLFVGCGAAQQLMPELAVNEGVPQPPEFHPEGEVLRHTSLVLSSLSEPVAPAVAWAAVLHDVGKKECFEYAADRIRFHGHDKLSAEMAVTWLEQHGAPVALVAAVSELVAEHIRIASVPLFRPARRRRFLSRRLIAQHLELHRADCLASHRKLDIYHELVHLRASMPAGVPEALLRGRDLLALGIPEGPLIGRLLAAVEEARYAEELATRQEAERYVRKLWKTDSVPEARRE